MHPRTCPFPRKGVSLCSAAVVLGTCLVIRYAESGRLAHCFNNKLLLWIGGISFSLYLVHMPLIAFYHSWFLHAPGWPECLPSERRPQSWEVSCTLQ